MVEEFEYIYEILEVDEVILGVLKVQLVELILG